MREALATKDGRFLYAGSTDGVSEIVGDWASNTVLNAAEAAQAFVQGEFYPRVTVAHPVRVKPKRVCWLILSYSIGISTRLTPLKSCPSGLRRL